MSTSEFHVREIIREYRQGSSVPMLAAASDGRQYIVKWTAGWEATAGILTDFLVNRICRSVCHFLPEEKFVFVGENAVVHPVHEEVRELVTFNRGHNLAIEFIDGAVEWKYEDGWKGSDEERALLFLIDLLFLNIDRTQENPNILLRNGMYYPIDFSCAMTVRGLIEGVEYKRTAMLPSMKRHPLYADECDVSVFTSRFSGVQRSDIQSAFEAIPSELAERVALSEIEAKVDFLYNRLQNAGDLLAPEMELLRAMPAYSAAERKARERSNRMAFQTKFMNQPPQ